MFLKFHFQHTGDAGVQRENAVLEAMVADAVAHAPADVNDADNADDVIEDNMFANEEVPMEFPPIEDEDDDEEDVEIGGEAGEIVIGGDELEDLNGGVLGDEEGGEGDAQALVAGEAQQNLAAEHQALVQHAPAATGYQAYNRPNLFPLRVRITIL